MRVYVAGPITKGNQAVNVQKGVRVADELLLAGHEPFCPHLSHFWEYLTGARKHELWMRLDLAWLEQCEALIRLPGESMGADAEVKHAKKHDIPVFDSVHTFLEWAA